MNEVIVFPPLTDTIVALLNDGYDEYDDPATAHSFVPNPRPARFTKVVRVGGVRTTIVTDAATIVVESWAEDDDQAHDLAQLSRALLHAAAGTVVDGVSIHTVDEFAGPANLPDPDSDQSRFTATYSVTCRGTALEPSGS